jgi:hypothetical protein
MAKTVMVKVIGREVHFSSFNRNRWRKFSFGIELLPFKYSNNRIFKVTLLGKDFRINWTPRNPR